MKIAFLYAGQGSQRVGMGEDLYKQVPTYKKTIDEVALKYKELMHKGPMEELSLTRNTQPCMAAFAAGVTNALFESGIKPDYVAGLSLGEYSALFAAEVFDAKTLVEVVAFRGMEMEKAAEGISCKMAAVLGSNRTVVQDVCKEVRDTGHGYVVIANYNCPGQYVLCGEKEAVERAEDLSLIKGAKRCIPLNVSGPFHTKFMEPAGEALRKKFEELSFNKSKIPVIYNATGMVQQEAETIQELLVKQVQSSVYFEDSIRTLLDAGVDTFIEIGPGKVLSGFVKKINREVTLYKIETAEELETVRMKMEELSV